MDILHNEIAFAKSDIKILVVDDREDNLFSIETILEQDGYSIVKANSGRAALKILLHEHDFTLILMDVQMPGMNGMETATLITEREKLKHIPIIFITAHHYGEEYIFQGYQMGGVDYIYKPINPELLRVKVAVFVELYRRNHELMHKEKMLIAANKRLENEVAERKFSEEKIRLLNNQLTKNNANLLASNQELDRFAYVASHDLQEPLRKILLFSDRLMKRSDVMPDQERLQYIQKISNASERMRQLVKDLLDFSRDKNEILKFQKTDLNLTLIEVLQDMELEIQRTGAKIVHTTLPAIDAIPSQIRQLFQNLISNSIKFSRKNICPEINIECKKIKGSLIKGTDEVFSECNYFNIFITDNGIGFDAKFAEDIFVVFKRLHSYQDIEGTGIGLSICKNIVDKHKGFISARSTINEGSTFTITLPEVVPILQEKALALQ